MIIILFDTPQTHQAFYPLSLTRPMALLRQGILTLQERWQYSTGLHIFTLADEYLSLAPIPESETYLYIDATFSPQAAGINSLKNLPENHSLWFNERLVAVYSSKKIDYPVINNLPNTISRHNLEEAYFLQHPWQLFQTNAATIATDYELLTTNHTSQPIDPTNIITGGTDIFIEPGATIKGCFINASEGPVYIGKEALVMEGACIRGPVAICNNAVVKMGAKLYGGTTIGPYCTAGGEIKNAILMGCCNKAHDGYLGDAVIGEWCNLGAGTTNSNVKNTAGTVRMWSGAALDFVPVGQKAGLLMGDYSRTAINTSLNTGTVVGVSSNILGGQLPPKHIPSFSWGAEEYKLEKALADISRWKAMKGQQLEVAERAMLNKLFLQETGETAHNKA